MPCYERLDMVWSDFIRLEQFNMLGSVRTGLGKLGEVRSGNVMLGQVRKD